MKRTILIVTAALICVAIAVGVFWFVRKPGIPKTRIAEKKLYEGPTTLPADTTKWPRWRGPLGDGISRETNLATRWPDDGPPELWAAEVGIGYSSPIAANGKVYLFTMNDSKETLTCFDANSGRILWNQEGGRGRTTSYPGTRATPAIDGNDIITLGGAGELTARDATTGARRWVVNILEQTGATPLDWGTASTPLVSGNLIFVQVGQGGPVALGINRADGAIAWRSEAVGIAGYAHPILAEVDGTTQLIVFGGKFVYGMDPQSGKTLWTHPWNTNWDVNAATPIYRDGKLFLTSAYGSGSIQLQISPGGAKELWKTKNAESRFQQAILDGDAVYLNSEGKLTALDWNDGKLLWKDEDSHLKLGVGGSFVRTADGQMIAMTERGKLSLLTATPAEFKVISEASIFDGAQIWATPLIYGGRLYVKGEQDLICYDISANAVSASK